MVPKLGAGGLALAVCIASACVSHRSPSLQNRFIHEGTPAIEIPGPVAVSIDADIPLPDVAGRVTPADPTPTAETEDAALGEALRALSALKVRPSASGHRVVAESYLRLGIFDRAEDHFSSALKIDKNDAVSLDGLARTWRDWGLPEMALTSAYRALALTPRSASVLNTLGTVHFALGQYVEAEQRFSQALSLDDRASYAHNNLCYVALMRGDAVRAKAECDAALALDAKLMTARNNLGLIAAAEGDMLGAQREFAAAGQPLQARYNFGMVSLARGDFAAAAEAFGVVCREETIGSDACERARQSRVKAASAIRR